MIPFHQITDLYSEPLSVKACLQNHATTDRLKVQLNTIIGNQLSSAQIHLTQSATAALELMALTLEIKPGDEIIMPSFTYPATANAFAKYGATIRFADIETKTLNIDPHEVARLITKRTRGIIPIHYGGIAADMKALQQIAGSDLVILEDASHTIGASFEGKSLGTIGDMGCISFHHTKNLTSAGSGGCLFVKSEDRDCLKAIDERLYQGTNRTSFNQGEVKHYQWQRLGGAYDMPMINQVHLLSQLAHLEEITHQRRHLWFRYEEALKPLAKKELMHIAEVPTACYHNGHIFYIYLGSNKEKAAMQTYLYENGIEAFSHYEPLHATEIGKRVGLVDATLKHTEHISQTLLRLPMYNALKDDSQDKVIDLIYRFFKTKRI